MVFSIGSSRAVPARSSSRIRLYERGPGATYKSRRRPRCKLLTSEGPTPVGFQCPRRRIWRPPICHNRPLTHGVNPKTRVLVRRCPASVLLVVGLLVLSACDGASPTQETAGATPTTAATAAPTKSITSEPEDRTACCDRSAVDAISERCWSAHCCLLQRPGADDCAGLTTGISPGPQWRQNRCRGKRSARTGIGHFRYAAHRPRW